MAEGKILPYLDIPFQHASPRVLKAMRRPAHQEKTLERLAALARDLPRPRHALDLHRRLPRRDGGGLRTCCWTGSRRPGSRASAASSTSRWRAPPPTRFAGAVPEEVKEERWHRFMAAQQEVSREVMAARVGRTIDVIVDEVDEEGAVGRSKWDAPEIDGSVFLDGASRRQGRATSCRRA